MPDSQKTELVGRSTGALLGGVGYLIYVLKGLPDGWSKDIFIIVSPGITLLSSYLWNLIRKILAIFDNMIITLIKEWMRDKKRLRIEKKLQSIIKNPVNKKDRDEAETKLMELHIQDLNKDINEFKKMN